MTYKAAISLRMSKTHNQNTRFDYLLNQNQIVVYSNIAFLHQVKNWVCHQTIYAGRCVWKEGRKFNHGLAHDHTPPHTNNHHHLSLRPSSRPVSRRLLYHPSS